MRQQEQKEAMIYQYLMAEQKRFYYIAFAYLKNREDALDAVQEAVYKAAVNSGKLQNPAAVKTWFYRILTNCCTDIARNRQKVVPMEGVGTDLEDESQTIAYEDYQYLYKALDKLDAKHKPVVILRFFEDMKLNEIADVLEISPNTVKTRLYAALKKLRISLEVVEHERAQ